MTIPFGKHRGKTLEWVMFNDPDYAAWIARSEAEGRFDLRTAYRFHQLFRRAHHLRIPGPCRWCRGAAVEHMVLTASTSGDRLRRVDFVCGDCAAGAGPRGVIRRPSLFAGRTFHPRDKTGDRVVLRAVKTAYFGTPSARMTQGRLEAFFDDLCNFTVPL